MNKKLQSDIMLLITALIWGSAFVAQKAGAVLEPFTYNGIRMLIGGLVLIPVIFIFKHINKDETVDQQKTEAEKQAEKRTPVSYTHLRHQQRSGESRRRRKLPQRPLLPAQRPPDRSSASAQEKRRYSGTAEALPRRGIQEYHSRGKGNAGSV